MAKENVVRFRVTEADKKMIKAAVMADAYCDTISEYLLQLVKNDCDKMDSVELFAVLIRPDKSTKEKKEVRRESIGSYLFEGDRSSSDVYKDAVKKCVEIFGECKYQENHKIVDEKGRELILKAYSSFCFFEKEEEKYYLFEKGQSNDYRRKTLKEIKDFFKPDEEIYSKECIDEWGAIKTIDDMQDFIDNYVNDEDGIHYHDYYIEK